MNSAGIAVVLCLATAITLAGWFQAVISKAGARPEIERFGHLKGWRLARLTASPRTMLPPKRARVRSREFRAAYVDDRGDRWAVWFGFDENGEVVAVTEPSKLG